MRKESLFLRGRMLRVIRRRRSFFSRGRTTDFAVGAKIPGNEAVSMRNVEGRIHGPIDQRTDVLRERETVSFFDQAKE